MKALGDQLACVEIPVRDENIIMTLFESLPASYEYLITALGMMLIKEFMIDYLTACLMHEISKCKQNEYQGGNATMILQKNKGGNSNQHQGMKLNFYCDKPGYIVCFCYKTKNK